MPHVSELAIDEAAAGDCDAATPRLAAPDGLSLLSLTREVGALGRQLVHPAALPSKAALDALHIAIAAVHGMNYPLTWNCTHIANATRRGRIEEVCRAEGFEPPLCQLS